MSGLIGQLIGFITVFRVLLDAYARRHEAQKIYMRQIAAQRCILARRQVLDATGSPNPSNEQQLYACNVQMQQVSVPVLCGVVASVHKDTKEGKRKACAQRANQRRNCNKLPTSTST